MKKSLSAQAIARFHRDGYLIIPHWVTGSQLETLQRVAINALALPQQPLELEAELGYPGSPSSTDTMGGDTVRRLQGAYQRNQQWQQWARSPEMKKVLQQLFDNPHILLSQAHHNCLMTKSPKHSSDTGWHQDTRYWSFEQPRLINSWLALGKEQPQNGGMWVIPGSHRLSFTEQQFDAAVFFREDMGINKPLINQATPVLLEPGDLLLFDARLLHKASRNLTDRTKYSLVFTYHDSSNHPLSGSRSSALPEIDLGS